MPFRFSIGQTVQYTPIGQKSAGVYKVTRRMPEEAQAADLKYRIKSETEAYERNVLECHLSPLGEGQSAGHLIEGHVGGETALKAK